MQYRKVRSEQVIIKTDANAVHSGVMFTVPQELEHHEQRPVKFLNDSTDLNSDAAVENRELFNASPMEQASFYTVLPHSLTCTHAHTQPMTTLLPNTLIHAGM